MTSQGKGSHSSTDKMLRGRVPMQLGATWRLPSSSLAEAPLCHRTHSVRGGDLSEPTERLKEPVKHVFQVTQSPYPD